MKKYLLITVLVIMVACLAFTAKQVAALCWFADGTLLYNGQGVTNCTVAVYDDNWCSMNYSQSGMGSYFMSNYCTYGQRGYYHLWITHSNPDYYASVRFYSDNDVVHLGNINMSAGIPAVQACRD